MKKINRIIIIDVECTCWERDDNKPHPELTNKMEIIEIGVCEVNLIPFTIPPTIYRNAGIYVKPEKSGISKFCTDLTGITPDMVENAGTLKDACKTLVESYQTKKEIWASWGDFDRNRFLKECEAKRIKYPFHSRHINIKTLFALFHKLEEECGVSKALDLLGMKFEGSPHSGKDDAYNIAKILVHLLKMGWSYDEGQSVKDS